MLPDFLRSRKSPWTTGHGPDKDVVLSSRIRLARNFRDFVFPDRLDREGAYRVWKLVSDATQGHEGFFFCDLSQTEPLARQVLVEKHLISPQHAADDKHHRAVLLHEDLKHAVMINEEDHVRLQCFAPGLDLNALWGTAGALDDAIGAETDYAYSDEWGYLTACPTNIGTGLRASVMLHLPALDKTGRISILNGLPAMGMAVRGLFGEGSKAYGHFYQISNQKTLGFREEAIIANLKAVTDRIITEERTARAHLAAETDAFEDRVFRSLGVLSQARIMTTIEAFELLSTVRIGIAQDVISEFGYEDIDPLFVAAQSGSLQYHAGTTLTEEERDRARASVIRETIHHTINQNTRSEEDVK